MRGAKEKDAAIFTFDEGLHNRFDALPIKLVLALRLAEDVIEVKHIGIVTILIALLPICAKKSYGLEILFSHDTIKFSSARQVYAE